MKLLKPEAAGCGRWWSSDRSDDRRPIFSPSPLHPARAGVVLLHAGNSFMRPTCVNQLSLTNNRWSIRKRETLAVAKKNSHLNHPAIEHSLSRAQKTAKAKGLSTTTTKIMSNFVLTFLLLLQAVGHCLSFSVSDKQQQQQRVFISTPSKATNRIVSDLMTSQPHLFTLAPHTPVDEAIATLLQAGVSGAPVIERLKNAENPDRVDCRLVGFVSSFDFLPREESGSLVTLGELEDSETARRILGQTVQDIMTRDPVTVTTNDLMKIAAETMAKHR